MDRLRVAILIAVIALLSLVTTALAQWPTTCVEANDAFEAAAGRHENIGIYQRVFGDQAEHACRIDHRDDVRSAFQWALGEPEPSPTTEPAPEPTPSPQPPAETSWVYQEGVHPQADQYVHVAYAISSTRNASVQVWCLPSTQDLRLAFQTAGSTRFTQNNFEGIPVHWRWNDDATTQEGKWRVDGTGTSVRIPEQQHGMIGYGLLHAGRLEFRVTDDAGYHVASTFQFTGGDVPNHPVPRVFQACGQSV
jgi:hypothetical protein